MMKTENEGKESLAELVRERKVLVLCGAGGVGKTTTSAALALAGAQAGRRVLVLTIDPAKRLAQAMGIPPNSSEPSPVPRERLDACGVSPEGSLDAWMLDPRVIFEGMVRRLAEPERAEQILANRLFRHLTDLVAGMQEYMAAEALYTFVEEKRYDLIVLDTPPSRNALEFLDAPGRVARFLDDGVVNLFLPKTGGGILRRAGRLVSSVFGRVFGDSFASELQTFLQAFSGMFGAMRSHTEGLNELLASPEAAFLLVTSTDEEAINESLFFRDEIARRGLPLSGFILNRSWARYGALSHPEALSLDDADDATRSGVEKFKLLADRERLQAETDRKLLEKLQMLADGRLAVAAPHLGEAVEDLRGLVELAQGLVQTTPLSDAVAGQEDAPHVGSH